MLSAVEHVSAGLFCPRIPFWTKIKEIGAKYVPSRNTDAKRQERAMRELMGKIPTKDPNVTEVVYLSEFVRCLECQRTVPMGIEVVTVKKLEILKAFSSANATAAHMVMIMKLGCKVRRFDPILSVDGSRINA